MSQANSDRSIWKYIGFMGIGALALYQLISGQETLIYIILIILVVISFVMYYKD